MLFVSAKVSQYALLPQGKVESKQRVLNMVKQTIESGGKYPVKISRGVNYHEMDDITEKFNG